MIVEMIKTWKREIKIGGMSSLGEEPWASVIWSFVEAMWSSYEYLVWSSFLVDGSLLRKKTKLNTPSRHSHPSLALPLHLPCNTQTHRLAEPSMTKTITNTTHTDFLAPRKSAMGPTWCGLSTGEAISPGWCLSFLDSTSTSTIGYKVSYNAKN